MISICLGNMGKLHRTPPKPRGNRTQNQLLLCHRSLDRLHLFNSLDMCLLLGGTRSGSPHQPFQLCPKKRFPLPLRCKLHFLPLCLQSKKARIICLIGINFSFINLHNPVGYAVEKIPVMRHHDNRPAESAQVILQPLCHGIVQMVGRLIQYE